MSVKYKLDATVNRIAPFQAAAALPFSCIFPLKINSLIRLTSRQGAFSYDPRQETQAQAGPKVRKMPPFATSRQKAGWPARSVGAPGKACLDFLLPSHHQGSQHTGASLSALGEGRRFILPAPDYLPSRPQSAACLLLENRRKPATASGTCVLSPNQANYCAAD